MELAQVWKQYLTNWPTSLPRRGVVVTPDEQIVFVAFLMSETVAMFERRAPDSVGGRKVMVPYSRISAIKVTDPVGDQPFLEAGFVERLQPKQAAKTASQAASLPPTKRDPTPQKA